MEEVCMSILSFIAKAVCLKKVYFEDKIFKLKYRSCVLNITAERNENPTCVRQLLW